MAEGCPRNAGFFTLTTFLFQKINWDRKKKGEKRWIISNVILWYWFWQCWHLLSRSGCRAWRWIRGANTHARRDMSVILVPSNLTAWTGKSPAKSSLSPSLINVRPYAASTMCRDLEGGVNFQVVKIYGEYRYDNGSTFEWIAQDGKVIIQEWMTCAKNPWAHGTDAGCGQARIASEVTINDLDRWRQDFCVRDNKKGFPVLFL